MEWAARQESKSPPLLSMQIPLRKCLVCCALVKKVLTLYLVYPVSRILIPSLVCRACVCCYRGDSCLYSHINRIHQEVVNP